MENLLYNEYKEQKIFNDGRDTMLTREDYQRVLEISHELNGILKRNTLDGIELYIKDGLAHAKIPDQEMFVMQGKNYQKVAGWAKNSSGQEDIYEEFLKKGKGLLS